MRIRFQYLGHFNAKGRQRIAWARAEASVRHGDVRSLRLVLDDGVRHYRNAPEIEEISLGQAFLYEDGFWCPVHSLGDHRRTDRMKVEHEARVTVRSDSVLPELGHHFFWNTFGYTMLSRVPDGNVFQTALEDARTYNNIINRKGPVFWDDTKGIEERVRTYVEANVMAFDDELYCRIDYPCFDVSVHRSMDGERLPPRRIFTPYGGLGGPVINYSKGYLTAEEYRHKFSWSRNRANSDLVVFDLPETGRMEPLERNMRAVFSALFRFDGWGRKSGAVSPGRRRKIIEKAFGIWVQGGYDFTERTLDGVADVLLPLSEEGRVRNAIEAWLDRSVEIDIAAVAGKHGGAENGRHEDPVEGNRDGTARGVRRKAGAGTGQAREDRLDSRQDRRFSRRDGCRGTGATRGRDLERGMR